MSPTLKRHYEEKYRKVAFYIAQNEKYWEETPPEVSFIVGLEDFTGKEKVKDKYKGPKEMEDKHRPYYAQTKKDVDIYNNKKQQEPNKNIRKRPSIKCPSLTNIWDSNIGRRITNVFC